MLVVTGTCMCVLVLHSFPLCYDYLGSCSCNTSITYTQILFLYVYASFSDVDECEGGIHDCRATKCNNTMGSYECINTPSFSTTSVAPSRSSPSTMSVATTMSSSSTMSVATTTSSSSIKTTVHSTTQVKENRNCLISHNNTQGSTQPAPVDEGIGTTVDQQATCVPISLVIALTIVTAVLIILLAVTAVAWRMQRNYIRSCELKWESHSNLDGLERIVSGKRHGREAGLPETSVELLNITSTAPTTIPGYINVGQPALIQANQDLYATIRVQEPVDGRLASIKTPDNERAAQSSQPIIDHSDYRTPTKQPHLQREVGATSREASQDVESKARLGSDVYDAVAIHDSERSSKGRTQSTSSGAKHIGNVYNAAMKADQHQYTNVKNHEHRTKDRATPKPPSSQRQDQTRHDHQRKQRYSSWHCGEETATSAVLIPQPHSDDAKRRHSFSPTADTLTHPELYRSPSVNSSSSKHSSKSPVIISQNVGTAEINSVSRPAELTPSVAKAAGVQTPVYARVDLPTKEAKRKHICTTTTDSTQKQTATEFPSITSTASVDAIVAQPDAHRATRPPPAESPKRRFPYTEVVFAKPPKVQLAPFPNLAAGNGAKGTEATGKSATIYASLAYSCAEN